MPATCRCRPHPDHGPPVLSTANCKKNPNDWKNNKAAKSPTRHIGLPAYRFARPTQKEYFR